MTAVPAGAAGFVEDVAVLIIFPHNPQTTTTDQMLCSRGEI